MYMLMMLIGLNIFLTTELFPKASGAYTCFFLCAMWFTLQETEGFVCLSALGVSCFKNKDLLSFWMQVNGRHTWLQS